ncbi:RND efflux system, outer membrane lipoprotein CmeC [Nitrincola lacisaponensis]|uniref:RND efflux system, outer membrane lipoprotein CmeC n=1 Tax=Nitrincola lacisaponensis TaxID=267850 RepID=A0A063Y5W3_9GAMM|nr:efflux transporter outer membrane subunit [Nitrincola lacisaponensis]KDE41039.1 RND efflux system, outer membrane lipoprotein CmeC [Nitrincola lacisaponensis]
MCKVIVFTAALALLTGCAVGPDYQVPATPEPQAFSGGEDILAGRTDQQRFWKGFDDPLLEHLIDQTLTSNLTLEEALARYERAAALLYGAERDQWPSLTANASASEQHLADIEQSPPGTGPERVQRFQAGVVASWELDLFGRLRRATEAQRAELEATGADLSAMQLALAGQLTNSYFELRGLQQQYQVAHRNLALQQQSLDIVEARVDAGRGTEFDKARAQVQLELTRAELPALQADIRAAMHRIAVLTGQPPLALVEQLSAQSGLPEVVPMIPVDTPGDVLRRRPDIAAAERRLAAATARIGVATADLFPRFTLSGLLSSVAVDSGDLFTGSAESRRVALGIDWTFLDHNRVKARIDAAGADNRAALASYQQTVLEALEEVETRLVRYQRAQQRDDRLAQAMNNAEKAVDLAHARYEEGFIGYFEVLTTEQEYVSTRDAAVRSRTEVILAMVDVYRSLMGAPD